MSANNAPSYILRYFTTTGLGEASRLLLTAANVEWTEESPEWPAEKPNQPFGRLPVLIEKCADGGPDFVITESATIERNLARRHGFMPTDLREAALQEQMRGRLTDLTVSFHSLPHVAGEVERKRMTWDILDKFIDVQTETLKKNGNSGYLFGESLSYADMVIYSFYKHLATAVVKFQADIVDILKTKLSPEAIKNLITIEADPALKAHTSKSTSITCIIQA